MRVKISMPTQVNLILPLPSIHSNFERKYDPLIFSLLCIEFHWKFLSTFLKVIKTILVSFMITAWRFLFLKNLIVLFTTPWKYLVRWELVNVYLENYSKEFSLTGWKCSSNWYLAFPKNRLSKSFLVLELLRLSLSPCNTNAVLLLTNLTRLFRNGAAQRAVSTIVWSNGTKFFWQRNGLFHQEKTPPPPFSISPCTILREGF